MTRFVIHNHLPARRVVDAVDSEFSVGQKVYLPAKGYHSAFGVVTEVLNGGKSYKVKAGGQVKEYHSFELKPDQHANRDFRGVVSRDQEERNRQESYDRTGIRRV
jgi:hypothetical protein